MGKNSKYKKHRNHYDKTQNEKKRAYQPTRPFRTVEGIESKTFEKLDMGAIGVLIEFYIKFDGRNRSNLSLTYREVKHKMSSLIFTRYIWQLIGYGFIDVRRWGRLERNCSLFGLSNRWRRLSTEPDKLDKIEVFLEQIERMKKQPGSQKKRMKMYALRKKILEM